MNGKHRVTDLSFPAELRFENCAIRLAEQTAREMGFSVSRIADIRTAVSEAVINAIEHSGTDQSGLKVHLILRAEWGHCLRMEVRDQGPGFDPQKIQIPQIEEKLKPERSKRGWGLFLIRSLADEVEVSSVEGQGNSLRLTFRLSS